MQSILNEIRLAYPSFTRAMASATETGSTYWVMEQFARFVIDMYERGERDSVTPAFEIAERGLATDRPEVRDAIVEGFLEALQNIASHRSFGAEAFVTYLGTRSREAWDQLNVVWQGKESLAEVVAAERGVSLHRPWWRFWRRRRSPREMLAKVTNPELRAIIEGMTREKPRK